MSHQQTWSDALNEAAEILQLFINSPELMNACQRFSSLLVETIQSGGNLFSCGNGGSHCDAMHFAEELTGRFRKDRRAIGALALGDPSHVTCVSNDFGFDHIFARQIEGLGRPGDLLVGLSTSGNSPNVLKAFEVAKIKGIKTIALTGKGGGKLKELAHLSIVVPKATTSDRIQEIHIKLIHTAIESAERDLFPEAYS